MLSAIDDLFNHPQTHRSRKNHIENQEQNSKESDHEYKKVNHDNNKERSLAYHENNPNNPNGGYIPPVAILPLGAP